MAEIIRPLNSFVKIDINIQLSLFIEISIICCCYPLSIIIIPNVMETIFNRTILCLFSVKNYH